MTPQEVRRLNMLNKQLTEYLTSAALCAKAIGEIALAELDDDGRASLAANGSGKKHRELRRRQRPLLDETTLSVIWKDKTLHLGHTRSFWLLAHLARRLGQYVTHLDLLRDVWDNEELATATIRSLVRRLRAKLQQGGMGDLAAAILGHNGRYMLNL
jgi:DNA-binding response OmpR family regulator